jgi:hypothetical protein
LVPLALANPLSDITSLLRTCTATYCLWCNPLCSLFIYLRLTVHNLSALFQPASATQGLFTDLTSPQLCRYFINLWLSLPLRIVRAFRFCARVRDSKAKPNSNPHLHHQMTGRIAKSSNFFEISIVGFPIAW